MGLFAPSPKVTPEEWKRIRNRLHDRGLSRQNLDDVEAVAHQALHEQGGSWGISRGEAKDIIGYLKRHRGSHHLSDKEIDVVEEAFGAEM